MSYLHLHRGGKMLSVALWEIAIVLCCSILCLRWMDYLGEENVNAKVNKMKEITFFCIMVLDVLLQFHFKKQCCISVFVNCMCACIRDVQSSCLC